MSNPYDQVARASDAGNVSFSIAKFKKMYPEYFSFLGAKKPSDGRPLKEWFSRLEDHLRHGDSRAAIVVSTNPLLVAAYTDELDCVALLQFPHRKRIAKRLSVGDRLLTVNTYFNLPKVVSDLQPGSMDSGSWQNFAPVIADFFSGDQSQIDRRKTEIGEPEWERTAFQGQSYVRDMHLHVRDGCPLRSMIPGTPVNLLPNAQRRIERPEFSVTPAALEQIRAAMAGLGLAPNTGVILLNTLGQHPEICERAMNVLSKAEVTMNGLFEIQLGDCTFVVSKEKAHAFDNIVLGFDRERGGFVFKNSH